jgi:hypothetical protein
MYNVIVNKAAAIGGHVVRDIVWTGVVVGVFDVVCTAVLLVNIQLRCSVLAQFLSPTFSAHTHAIGHEMYLNRRI